MITVLLALGASLSWGTADFMAGLQARRWPLLTVVIATQLSGAIGLGIVVAIRGDGPPDATAIAFACAAGVTGAAGIAGFYRALATGTMSVVAPLLATGTIVPVLVGFGRGERPSAPQLAGMAVAAIGALAVVRIETGHDRGTGSRGAVLLALGAALLVGLTLTGLALGAEGDAYWSVLLYRCVTFGVATGAALALRRSTSAPPSAIPVLALVGILDALGMVLFAVASDRGLLSVVAVLAALYPVVTASLAHAQLGERLRPAQLGAVLLVLGGIAAISAG